MPSHIRSLHTLVVAVFLLSLLVPPVIPQLAAAPSAPKVAVRAPAAAMPSPLAQQNSPPPGCAAAPAEVIPDPLPPGNDGVFLPILFTSGTAPGSVVVAPPLPLVTPAAMTPAQAPNIGGATTFSETVAFLYTGTNPPQQGVNAAIIGDLCVGVIRGTVGTRDGAPLSNVAVSVHGRPEYGSVRSAADGTFSLAVNGGEHLVLNYVIDGYLPAQRPVDVPRRDYVWAEPVVLIPLDSKVTNVAADDNTLQVVRGNSVNDSDGTRTATLLVPAGTSAEMVMADGTSQELSSLAIRATEYTVGDTGPAAMPGELPPQSGYTYALEYSVDAALTAGAAEVRFDQPIFHYVENFLDFPAGTPVPMGYYDRVEARWVPSDDGIVIAIIGETAGLADVDSNGDGIADTLLGMSADERQSLAELYNPGASLWRVAITHFTPWDCNWPFGPPDDATAPDADDEPQTEEPPDTVCPQPNNADLLCQSQALNEMVDVPGSAFSLVYQSDRVRGHTAAASVTIPLSGAAPPASLKRIEVEIVVAGKREVRTFAPAANLSTTYTWDGRDVYGNLIQGRRPVYVRIGFVYDGVYNQPADGGRAFGRASGVTIEGSRSREEVTIYREWRGTVGTRDDRDLGLGGWSFDALHRYDPFAQILYLGDGARRALANDPLGDKLSVVAGGGFDTTDPVTATLANLNPQALVTAPDGTIYFADERRVRAVTPDGIVRTVAGNGVLTLGDNRPALQGLIDRPTGIAFDSQGRLIIADTWNNSIRRIEASGVISTVFGIPPDERVLPDMDIEGTYLPLGLSVGPDGSYYFTTSSLISATRVLRLQPNGTLTRVAGGGASFADGVSALETSLSSPSDVEVGPDGNLYISVWSGTGGDGSGARIRRVNAAGIITTVVGGGNLTTDGVAATDFALSVPQGVAFDTSGDLYIADFGRNRVYKVDLNGNGTISAVAGTGSAGFSGDGSSALSAQLDGPRDVAVLPDGTLYIVDADNQRIRRVSPAGVISTIAGTGQATFGGDNGPAVAASLRDPRRITVGPDGLVYISDNGNDRIRRINADGTIITVVGGLPPGDNGPALAAELVEPADLAIGSDGSLYIADAGDFRVRRVDPAGIIHTVAGNGIRDTFAGVFGSGVEGTFSGDGGPALQAGFYDITGMSIAPDDTLYLADRLNAVIRAISPDGNVRTVAGTGNSGTNGDGGPATLARIGFPNDVAYSADGSLYIADGWNARVRRVAPSGIISTIAGGGSEPFTAGDGFLGTAVRLDEPDDLAVLDDGSLVFADDRRIRRVYPDGIIDTIAGGGDSFGALEGANPLTLDANFTDPALSPDGAIYLVVGFDQIVRLTSADGGLAQSKYSIPSEDGALLYDFDARGTHVRTRDALTNATRFVFRYDSAGRLTTVIDGNGLRTTVERDTNGNPQAILGPYGARTTLALDANGYLSRLTSPAGNVHQFAYGTAGLLSTITDPRNGISNYQYDSFGYLIGATDRLGNSQELVRSVNGVQSVVTHSDQLGRTTIYTTEQLLGGGESLAVQNPAGQISTLDQAAGGTTNFIRPDGSRMSEQLNADARLGTLAPFATTRTITTPGGLEFSQTVSQNYEPNEDGSFTQSTFINTNAAFTSITYDSALRTMTVDPPVSQPEVLTLDDEGRVIERSAPAMATIRYRYDSRGRPVELSLSSNSGTRTYRMSYGTDGRLSDVRDPIGNSTANRYDADGRLITRILADGAQIQMTYDAADNLTGYTPPGRPAHQFSYTPDDLLAGYTPPGGQATTYSYDESRRLTQVNLPEGNIDYTYDPAGRITGQTLAAGTTAVAYNSVGQPMSIDAPGGIGVRYTYDGALVIGEQWLGPVAGGVTYTYDDDFRIAGDSISGQSVSYDYDDEGRLIIAGALQLSYGTNRALSERRNGVVREQIRYNSFVEPISYTLRLDNTLRYSRATEYDALGRTRVLSETLLGTRTRYDYRYDANGRLVEVLRNNQPYEAYSYDANGNRTAATVRGTTITATYNTSDQLLTYGDTSYLYDANGRLKSRTVGGQTSSYQYDELGRLLKVTLANGTQISYRLDGRGRRIGRLSGANITAGWLYNQDQRVVAELNPDGSVRSRFIYDTPVGAPSLMLRDGKTYRIINDERGSPRLVIDSADGSVAQRIDYDSFGVVLSDSNPGFQPFGFAGGLYDSATGLIRFGARDYDPQIGRFTARDPILFIGGDSNLYAYVDSDPVNYSDPKGLEKYCATFYFGFGGGGCVTTDGKGGFAVSVETGVGVGWDVTFSCDTNLGNNGEYLEISGSAKVRGLVDAGGAISRGIEEEDGIERERLAGSVNASVLHNKLESEISYTQGKGIDGNVSHTFSPGDDFGAGLQAKAVYKANFVFPKLR